jgi:hypothetical protein
LGQDAAAFPEKNPFIKAPPPSARPVFRESGDNHLSKVYAMPDMGFYRAFLASLRYLWKILPGIFFLSEIIEI